MDEDVIGSLYGYDIYTNDEVIKITGFDEYEFPTLDEAYDFLQDYKKS